MRRELSLFERKLPLFERKQKVQKNINFSYYLHKIHQFLPFLAKQKSLFSYFSRPRITFSSFHRQKSTFLSFPTKNSPFFFPSHRKRHYHGKITRFSAEFSKNITIMCYEWTNVVKDGKNEKHLRVDLSTKRMSSVYGFALRKKKTLKNIVENTYLFRHFQPLEIIIMDAISCNPLMSMHINIIVVVVIVIVVRRHRRQWNVVDDDDE